MSSRRLRQTALGVLAAVALAACGGGSGTTDGAAPADGGSAQGPAPTGSSVESDGPAAPTPADDGDATGAPATADAANAEVLAFSGVDLQGDPVDARQFAGGDVILWMWAPW